MEPGGALAAHPHQLDQGAQAPAQVGFHGRTLRSVGGAVSRIPVIRLHGKIRLAGRQHGQAHRRRRVGACVLQAQQRPLQKSGDALLEAEILRSLEMLLSILRIGECEHDLHAVRHPVEREHITQQPGHALRCACPGNRVAGQHQRHVDPYRLAAVLAARIEAATGIGLAPQRIHCVRFLRPCGFTGRAQRQQPAQPHPRRRLAVPGPRGIAAFARQHLLQEHRARHRVDP